MSHFEPPGETAWALGRLGLAARRGAGEITGNRGRGPADGGAAAAVSAELAPLRRAAAAVWRRAGELGAEALDWQAAAPSPGRRSLGAGPLPTSSSQSSHVLLLALAPVPGLTGGLGLAPRRFVTLRLTANPAPPPTPNPMPTMPLVLTGLLTSPASPP